MIEWETTDRTQQHRNIIICDNGEKATKAQKDFDHDKRLLKIRIKTVLLCTYSGDGNRSSTRTVRIILVFHACYRELSWSNRLRNQLWPPPVRAVNDGKGSTRSPNVVFSSYQYEFREQIQLTIYLLTSRFNLTFILLSVLFFSFCNIMLISRKKKKVISMFKINNLILM